MKKHALMFLNLLLAATQAHAIDADVENLVAFHNPGPNWEQRAEHAEAVLEHREIYKELARNGEILVGGRFTGEPVLGMSIFRSGICREELTAKLGLDPSVVAGVIKLEIRGWQTQLGSLPPSISDEASHAVPSRNSCNPAVNGS